MNTRLQDKIYYIGMHNLVSVLTAIFSMYYSFIVVCYRGHQNSTFYVKATLSPDDQFLLSGSRDNNAYIWKVGQLVYDI